MASRAQARRPGSRLNARSCRKEATDRSGDGFVYAAQRGRLAVRRPSSVSGHMHPSERLWVDVEVRRGPMVARHARPPQAGR